MCCWCCCLPSFLRTLPLSHSHLSFIYLKTIDLCLFFSFFFVFVCPLFSFFVLIFVLFCLFVFSFGLFSWYLFTCMCAYVLCRYICIYIYKYRGWRRGAVPAVIGRHALVLFRPFFFFFFLFLFLAVVVVVCCRHSFYSCYQFLFGPFYSSKSLPLSLLSFFCLVFHFDETQKKNSSYWIALETAADRVD